MVHCPAEATGSTTGAGVGVGVGVGVEAEADAGLDTAAAHPALEGGDATAAL